MGDLIAFPKRGDGGSTSPPPRRTPRKGSATSRRPDIQLLQVVGKRAVLILATDRARRAIGRTWEFRLVKRLWRDYDGDYKALCVKTTIKRLRSELAETNCSIVAEGVCELSDGDRVLTVAA